MPLALRTLHAHGERFRRNPLNRLEGLLFEEVVKVRFGRNHLSRLWFRRLHFVSSAKPASGCDGGN